MGSEERLFLSPGPGARLLDLEPDLELHKLPGETGCRKVFSVVWDTSASQAAHGRGSSKWKQAHVLVGRWNPTGCGKSFNRGLKPNQNNQVKQHHLSVTRT